MTAQAFQFYWQSSLVCILIFLIMLISDLSDPNRQEKQIVFRRVIIVHMLYFANDIYWAAIESGAAPFFRPAVVLVNLANFVLVAMIAYEWLMFVAVNTDMPLRKTKKGRMLAVVPYYVMLAVMIIGYLAAPDFWLSDTGELNTAYYIMMMVSPLIYVVWASAYALWCAGREHYHLKRKTLIIIGLYPIEVVFFGLLETLFFLSAPLFCFGLTVMMLFFYIQNQSDNISRDPLTGLNNRGQLKKYLATDARGRAAEGNTYIVMIDANDFKTVNDAYGHAEGDHALVLIAQALRQAADRVKSELFIARYGGDEFIIIDHIKGEETPEELKTCIREELVKLREEHHLKYSLSVGIGYDRWQKEEAFERCMIRADKNLYTDKKQIKQAV